MTFNMKVWVLSHGDYADNCVLGVTSSEDVAADWAESDTYNHAQELVLDAKPDDHADVVYLLRKGCTSVSSTWRSL